MHMTGCCHQVEFKTEPSRTVGDLAVLKRKEARVLRCDKSKSEKRLTNG